MGKHSKIIHMVRYAAPWYVWTKCGIDIFEKRYDRCTEKWGNVTCKNCLKRRKKKK